MINSDGRQPLVVISSGSGLEQVKRSFIVCKKIGRQPAAATAAKVLLMQIAPTGSLADPADVHGDRGRQVESVGDRPVLRSIRSRLLLLVVATVLPFSILIGAGLWSQWRSDQAAAIQQTIDEARLLAAQVDDHIGNLENLLIGTSRAVSANPLDKEANDALLRSIKSEQPDFVGEIELLALDGTASAHHFLPGRCGRTRRIDPTSLRF
jgi:hypothetical protein